MVLLGKVAMKNTLVTVIFALFLVYFDTEALARSLKSALRSELFGGSNPFFLTVPNPAFTPTAGLPQQLLVLTADTSPTRLGKPISAPPTFGDPLLAIGNFGGGLGN